MRFWFATYGRYPGTPGVTGQVRDGTRGLAAAVDAGLCKRSRTGLAEYRAGR